MINLNSLLYFSKIESLGYNTAYVEKPVPDIVDFNWKQILQKPPSNTSTKTINELRVVSKATHSRTKEDIKKLDIIDQDLDYYFIELLNNYNLKYPQQIINNFYSIIEPILFNIKMLFNRPRPEQLGKYYNIHIDVIVSDTHDTASYPSGHTVYSSLVASIIKDQYPSIPLQKLNNIVQDTAKSRILKGVHFPSDNKASLELTTYLYQKLKGKIL